MNFNPKITLKNFSIAVFILILLGLGYWYGVRPIQLKTKECKERCRYNPTAESYILRIGLGSRPFPDLNECVDYCKDHFEE